MCDSPWSAQALMRKLSRDTNALLGDYTQQSLCIDESSNGKAGKNSVGVSRQHNGNLGKVDNCQTGVYAFLCSGNKVGIIDTRLFLPDQWVDDPQRCKKAGMPKEAIVKKTKIELALDMIRESIEIGVKFGWVNADGLYGSSYNFCKTIEELGKDFVVGVNRDQQVYLQIPKSFLPEFKGLGRKIIRKGFKKTDPVKFSISSIALNERTIQQFAFMQGQRYWEQRALGEGKGELGMADYQVRKYNAWFHHQALVMLAMQFVNKKKYEFKEDLPLLSVRDVRLLLITTLKEQGTQMEKEID